MDFFEQDLPREIEKRDIDFLPPEIGGTKIVLQRHGQYERLLSNARVGSLTEEAAEGIYTQGKDFFEKLFESILVPERKGVDILVVASDTQYGNRGYRSMETGDQVVRAVKEELDKFNLEDSQLLNTSSNIHGDGGPRPTSQLGEPQMFVNSPEFVNFLTKEYGDRNLDFWIAFEEDKEKDIRIRMGAEGPDEITDRMKTMIEVFSRYSRFYHKNHPDKRLIIWAVTHYDTISPFVKREVFKTEKETPLGVGLGAGISINLDKNGVGTTKISGKKYKIS